jgi:hypothetical protein
MLGYDGSMPWWELLILVSLAYFANDIALLLARLCLARHDCGTERAFAELRRRRASDFGIKSQGRITARFFLGADASLGRRKLQP